MFHFVTTPGPEVIQLFSYSTQMSMNFILLINVKMPTVVGILTFISMKNATSEFQSKKKIFIFQYLRFYEQLKFHAQLMFYLILYVPSTIFQLNRASEA